MRAYKVIKPGVKDSTARVEASKLLTNPDVQRRIVQIRAELKRRYRVTAEDLMQYHGKVLKIDRGEYLDDDGRPRKLGDIDPEAASILEFDCEKDSKGNIRVLFKVPQRHQSAVELARMMGMHKDKMELTGKDGGPVEHSVKGLLSEIMGTTRELVSGTQQS
jgi:phage terminase small subunit